MLSVGSDFVFLYCIVRLTFRLCPLPVFKRSTFSVLPARVTSSSKIKVLVVFLCLRLFLALVVFFKYIYKDIFILILLLQHYSCYNFYCCCCCCFFVHTTCCLYVVVVSVVVVYFAVFAIQCDLQTTPPFSVPLSPDVISCLCFTPRQSVRPSQSHQ